MKRTQHETRATAVAWLWVLCAFNMGAGCCDQQKNSTRSARRQLVAPSGKKRSAERPLGAGSILKHMLQPSKVLQAKTHQTKVYLLRPRRVVHFPIINLFGQYTARISVTEKIRLPELDLLLCTQLTGLLGLLGLFDLGLRPFERGLELFSRAHKTT